MTGNKEIQLPITIVSKYEKKNWIFPDEYYIVYRIANGSNTGKNFVQEVNFNDYLKTFFVYQTYNVTFVDREGNGRFYMKQTD